MRARQQIGVVVLVALAASGCSSSVSSPSSELATGCSGASALAGHDAPLRLVTTVAPITNIVAIVASGGDLVVTGIVPEGTDSHTYSPAPSAAAALERADIVFLNGLGLEAPTAELANANSDDRTVICELGTAILPPGSYIFDFSFPESAGLPNPHLWTNPPMVRSYVELIRDVLTEADPVNAALYDGNAAAFAAQIDLLDGAIRAATASIDAEHRQLLTYHDAYAYFADEYGWDVIGAVQPSSFNEPTPRELAALIEQVRSSGVTAIFGSEVFPSPVLRQLADETGVEYVDDLRDDDLPGRPGEAQHQWLVLMVGNMITIVDALGGNSAPLTTLDLAPVRVDEAEYAE